MQAYSMNTEFNSIYFFLISSIILPPFINREAFAVSVLHELFVFYNCIFQTLLYWQDHSPTCAQVGQLVTTLEH